MITIEASGSLLLTDLFIVSLSTLFTLLYAIALRTFLFDRLVPQLDSRSHPSSSIAPSRPNLVPSVYQYPRAGQQPIQLLKKLYWQDTEPRSGYALRM